MSVDTSTPVAERSASAAAHTELKRNVLTTWDVISQALAFLGPVMSMSVLTAPIAMAAGPAVPLAVFLGGLTMVALGYVVAQFASRVHAAGAIYNYAAKALGPEAGFMGGWVYLFATLLLTIAIIAGVAGWAVDFFSMVGWLAPSPYLWVGVVILECIALYLLAYFDIRISTRTQLWLVFGSVTLVVLLAGYVILKGGAAGHSLAAFSPAAAGPGLTTGLIFAILMYTGFESAAVLAEETANPRRSMPIAIIGTVAAAVVLYIFVTYAYTIGFGAANLSVWQDPNTPALFSLAGMYGGANPTWLVTLVFLALIVDGFAVAMGCLTTSARVAYAIARDGALPRYLSRTHPTHKTPYLSNATVLGLAVAAAIAFAAIIKPTAGTSGVYMTEFMFLAGIGAITIEVIYVFVSVAAVVWFRRALGTEYSIVKHLLVPIVAIVGASAALYGSLLPQPDPLLATMPYVALGWIVFGGLYIVLLRATRPGLVAKIGRDLSEMEAPSEPVDIRFSHDATAAD